MKQFGNLKKQVDGTTSKEGLIEKAGMQLTDDELGMVSGGYPLPRVVKCDMCNNNGLFGDPCP